jgi:Raf kinase inhibitor-like YbhB/YbcL family protein
MFLPLSPRAVLAWLAVFAMPVGAMELLSRDFADGATLPPAQVYAGYGCTGGNVSPALSWTGAPTGTRSFALTMTDPDAPGGTWWHWVMFDIPAGTQALARGAGSALSQMPGVRQARNDFGTRDYGGACPPAGDPPHRYVFTVHALKVDRLAVPENATAARAGAAIKASELGQASITARYGR